MIEEITNLLAMDWIIFHIYTSATDGFFYIHPVNDVVTLTEYCLQITKFDKETNKRFFQLIPLHTITLISVQTEISEGKK